MRDEPPREAIGPGAVVLKRWIHPEESQPEQVKSGVSTMGGGGDVRDWISAVRSVVARSPFRHMERRRGVAQVQGEHASKSASAKLTVAMTNCGTWGWTSDPISGYRYSQYDPLLVGFTDGNESPENATLINAVETDHQSGANVATYSDALWPPLPAFLAQKATLAAEVAGYPNFTPDCCLINEYRIGSRLALHADKDEADLVDAPIVSVSLGLPCTFLWEALPERGPERGQSRKEEIPPCFSSSSSLSPRRGVHLHEGGGFEPSDGIRRLRLESGDVVVWGGASRLALHGVMPLEACSKSSPAYRLLGGVRWNLTFRLAKGFYRR